MHAKIGRSELLKTETPGSKQLYDLIIAANTRSDVFNITQPLLSMQEACMVCNMFSNERGHEVVGVVIPSLHPESDRNLSLDSCIYEGHWPQLIDITDEKVVGRSTVTKN